MRWKEEKTPRRTYNKILMRENSKNQNGAIDSKGTHEAWKTYKLLVWLNMSVTETLKRNEVLSTSLGKVLQVVQIIPAPFKPHITQ